MDHQLVLSGEKFLPSLDRAVFENNPRTIVYSLSLFVLSFPPLSLFLLESRTKPFLVPLENPFPKLGSADNGSV